VADTRTADVGIGDGVCACRRLRAGGGDLREDLSHDLIETLIERANAVVMRKRRAAKL
jgi:hypothetical protein